MGTINGTSGADNLQGTATRPADGGLTVLIGGAGNDTITGYLAYWNLVDYGTSPSGIIGNLVTGQVLDGFGSTDTLINVIALRGSSHNDTLIGTHSSVWNVIEGMAGNDSISGFGNIANGVSYSQSPGSVVVNLATGIASDGWGGTDTLSKVVRVTGSNYADVLTGAATDDWFSASLGNDAIDGDGGLNTLDYSALNGGLASGLTVAITGDNAGIVAKRPWGSVADSTDFFSNIQIVKGTNGADRMIGWAGASQDIWLRPQIGNDTINGAQNAHNIADYTDSPVAVVIKLEVTKVGTDWFGTASDGFQVPGQPSGTYYSDSLVNVAGVYGSNYSDSISGSSQDDVIKSGWGNDTIDGGAGSDTALFDGSRAAASWWRNADGSWSVRNGVNIDRLYNVENLAFDDGVVRLPTRPDDLDGNGRSEILLANDTATSGGTPAYLLKHVYMNGITYAGESYIPPAGQGWSVIATGDFNHDGRVDLLWQHATQGVAIWLMNDSAFLGGATIYSPPPTDAWTVAGVGDFNGDGKDDILFTHDAVWAGKTYTELLVWNMNGFQTLGTTSLGSVLADWHVSGVADFNNDGYADILWRRDAGDVAIWLADSTGKLTGTTLATITNDWKIAGTGDFNGDGKSDIIWRNDNGAVSIWLMDGTTYLDGDTLDYNPGNQWTIAGIGDFNGDGKSDILWRQAPVPGVTTTDVVIWLMDGLKVATNSATIASVTNDWQIV